MKNLIFAIVIFTSGFSFSDEGAFDWRAFAATCAGGASELAHQTLREQFLPVVIGCLAYKAGRYLPPPVTKGLAAAATGLAAINVVDHIEYFLSQFTGHAPVVADYNYAPQMIGLIPFPNIHRDIKATTKTVLDCGDDCDRRYDHGRALITHVSRVWNGALALWQVVLGVKFLVGSVPAKKTTMNAVATVDQLTVQMPISIAPTQAATPPVSLVIVADKSMSMRGTRLKNTRAAILKVLDLLDTELCRDQSRVFHLAIIHFGESSSMRSEDQKLTLERVRKLKADYMKQDVFGTLSESTKFLEPIVQAGECLHKMKYRAGKRCVVFITDGIGERVDVEATLRGQGPIDFFAIQILDNHQQTRLDKVLTVESRNTWLTMGFHCLESAKDIDRLPRVVGEKIQVLLTTDSRFNEAWTNDNGWGAHLKSHLTLKPGESGVVSIVCQRRMERTQESAPESFRLYCKADTGEVFDRLVKVQATVE